MKRKVFQLASLGLIACTLASSCGEAKKEQQQGQAAPSISVITVQPTDAEFQSSFPATIKGKTDIAIRPQVSGYITKVHVDEGQRVHRGQVLFSIDPVQFQAAVDQAAANVNSARSAVSTAQISEENKRKLLEKNIISRTEWQMAENQLSQANAALAQAEAALVNARKNLAYTTVTSPSDGVVGTIDYREGSLASPSMALTTVSDNSEVYAYFSFNEKDLLKFSDSGIKSMPKVKLQLADGSIYPEEGEVVTISGVIDGSTGAASARALFPNPNGVLRSGNTGNVLIPRVTKDALVIPQKSTYELQDRRYVFTLNDSNYTVPTPIVVSPYSDGQNFVVTSGLKPGDRVVTEGVGTVIRANMAITPKEQAQ